eukprot:2896689-Lingulodinium_polyedra.AAC.1
MGEGPHAAVLAPAGVSDPSAPEVFGLSPTDPGVAAPAADPGSTRYQGRSGATATSPPTNGGC